MIALKNLPISRKLMLAFAVMVGATAIMSGLVMRQIGVADTVRMEAEATAQRGASVDRLVRQMLEREVAAFASVRDGSGAADRFETASAEIANTLEGLRATLVEPVEAARVSRLGSLDAQYRAEMTDLMARAAVPETRAEAQAALAASEGQEPMRGLIRGITQTADAAVAAQDGAFDSALSDIRDILIAGMLATIGIAALLCLLLMRGIAAPTRSMARAMTRLSKGESDMTLKVLGRRDEVGEMAGAVEVFRQNLLRTRALEAEAAQARTHTEEAGRRTESDRQRQLGEQEHVVETLQDALTQLSAGNLTCRIEAEFPGRYARLRDEFNKAAEHLHDTLGRVASSVSSIANGTNEIGHASDDLSRRTEQQAASLDKTASALDEITATVKHSAENAASVASSVAAARQDTERSGEVMREAVEAMTAIQKSSQQIARIIGVIDEIAFQTNLLALNAGVEAARAGDAGRGFAVVALEVRALAQRSSEAAKEIKTLIGASSTQVGNGVDLVNRSGEVLTRIAAQVTQIDALVQEIAGSAREQSIGIADVNDAVNKMDRVTQQNAAMVEETTAATLSLRTETEELGRLVAAFRVDAVDSSVAQLRDMSSVMKAQSRTAPAAAPRLPAPPAPRAATAAAAPATAAAEDLGWEEF